MRLAGDALIVEAVWICRVVTTMQIT